MPTTPTAAPGPDPTDPDRPLGADGPRLVHRDEDGRSWPLLVWRFEEPRRTISSAPVGGGLGARSWVLNAQVRPGYDRVDLAAHVDELATIAGVSAPASGAPGVGMLTAANVGGAERADDGDAIAVASVGIRVPTWAAAPDGVDDPHRTAAELVASGWRPGTINVVVEVPVPMGDAALVNLIATATEAKTQAMLDAGIPGTGTATDAICVVCPDARGGATEPFGGPRSRWGARVARATFAAVRSGIDTSVGVIGEHEARAASADGAPPVPDVDAR